MQCSMRNQCSGLFTYIMDYLHVLCLNLMVLSCVLCMTLMAFIYMYYGLFACTNLVDVMMLFFMVFLLHLLIFDKNRPVSGKIRPNIATPIFRKNHRFIGEIGRLIAKTGRILIFQISTVTPSFPVHFDRIFLNFTDFFDFFKN
jgi:hypothetical protein